MLKYSIRQPRPIGADRFGYGMPSTHSVVVWFYAVSCLYCLRPILGKGHVGVRRLWWFMVGVAGVVSYTRYVV